MGLFGIGKKRTSVTVHGSSTFMQGSDGRYTKQAKKNKKIRREKEKGMVLEPHTPAELRGYIENKYGVQELDQSDDRFKRAYMGIKAHLVFEHAPELVETPEMEEPKHPPVSEHDPDYMAYRENREIRWKEAVKVDPEKFPMHLHVYNIAIMQVSGPAAWLEVYVETEHAYLAFKEIALEYEEQYTTKRVIADIVKYFGASEADRELKNERYVQLVSVQ